MIYEAASRQGDRILIDISEDGRRKDPVQVVAVWDDTIIDGKEFGWVDVLPSDHYVVHGPVDELREASTYRGERLDDVLKAERT